MMPIPKTLKQLLLLISCAFLIHPLALYADGGVIGEGQFQSVTGDAGEFIKKQLLYSAFKDAINKELETMGLSAASFWENHEQRVSDGMNPIEAELKEKHKIADESSRKKMSASQLRDAEGRYEAELRPRRLEMALNLSKISRAIVSYSVKKSARSTSDSNQRFVTIAAKIDRKVLNSLFFKMTRVATARHYNKLFLTTHFNLENTTWNELGVETNVDFTRVVNEHWLKFLQENLAPAVDQIQLADEDAGEKLKEQTDRRDAGQAEGDEATLWLIVTSTINKKNEDKIAKSREFSISEEYILMDVNSGQIVSHFDFPGEFLRSSYENNQELSSALASAVYRMATPQFKNFTALLGSLGGTQNTASLEVANVNSMADLQSFNDFITAKGAKLQITPVIEYYGVGYGKLSLFYKGELEELKALLLSLENQKMNEKRAIVFPSRDNPFGLALSNAGPSAN